MHRRAYLAVVAAALAGTAGCVSSGGAGPTDSQTTDQPTDQPTDRPATSDQPPAVADTGFERSEKCDEPGSAAVATYDRAPPTVNVTGCIVGKNGCTVPVLSDATYDADADELRVVVGTEERRDENEVCTEALVHLGYHCTVEFAHGGPGTVVVVHDGVEGRREVARATFD